MASNSASGYQEVLKLVKDNKCQFIDLKFIDLPGTWQHYTLPIKELEDLFEEGNGFDGSLSEAFVRFTRAICCSSLTRLLR